MTMKLTRLQANLLRLAKSNSLSGKTYREIAEIANVGHPYTVQQAINSLIAKDLLTRNQYTGAIEAIDTKKPDIHPLIKIPVMGYVSCGTATALAQEAPSDFITLSRNVARIRKPESTFALIASGESMTRAEIGGKAVEEGDYVIVEKRSWGEASDGEYVVSRFNETNNLKKLSLDPFNRRIILLSESKDSTPPIIISEDDIQYFAIEGVAIDIVKGLQA